MGNFSVFGHPSEGFGMIRTWQFPRGTYRDCFDSVEAGSRNGVISGRNSIKSDTSFA
jgi:hypothetical protein